MYNIIANKTLDSASTFKDIDMYSYEYMEDNLDTRSHGYTKLSFKKYSSYIRYTFESYRLQRTTIHSRSGYLPTLDLQSKNIIMNINIQ